MTRTLVQKLNRTQKLNFSFPFLPSQVSAAAELTLFRYKPHWSSKASFRFTSLRRQPYLVFHSKIPKYICSEMRKKMCTLDSKLKFLHNAFHPFKTRDFLIKANKTSKNRSAWRTVSQIHSHYICNCSVGNVTIVRLPKISVSLTCTKHSNKRYNLKLLWPWLDTRRLRKFSFYSIYGKKILMKLRSGQCQNLAAKMLIQS